MVLAWQPKKISFQKYYPLQIKYYKSCLNTNTCSNQIEKQIFSLLLPYEFAELERDDSWEEDILSRRGEWFGDADEWRNRRRDSAQGRPRSFDRSKHLGLWKHSTGKLVSPHTHTHEKKESNAVSGNLLSLPPPPPPSEWRSFVADEWWCEKEGERTTSSKIYNNLFFLLDKIHYLHDVLTYEVWQGKIFDDKISIIRSIQSISNIYTKMLLFFFSHSKIFYQTLRWFCHTLLRSTSSQDTNCRIKFQGEGMRKNVQRGISR